VDFGYSSGVGGIVAFSRVVSDIEVVLVANTNTTQGFNGFVFQDPDLNRHPRKMHVAHSNLNNGGSAVVRCIANARVYQSGQPVSIQTVAALFVKLAPKEVQVWVPEQPFPF
jgi:hypothetical protein